MLSGIRWRWHLLALVPGALSNLIFLCVWLVSLNARHNPDWIAPIGTMMLWTGLCLPLATPFYVYVVGRGYVRAFAGFKSAFPFALLYSAANFALWLGGIVLVVVNVDNFR